MKENNVVMSYEMYEDFKETMVKTIKTELSAKHNQSTDTDLPQRIEQIVRTEQERHRVIITQLAGRLENIEQSNAKTQNGIDNLQAAVDAIEIPAELPPRITQHRISFVIESKGVFGAMIGMMSTIGSQPTVATPLFLAFYSANRAVKPTSTTPRLKINPYEF